MPSLDIIDFSGGITDNLTNAKPNQAIKMDNLLINSDKKAISRYGSVLYDTSNDDIPTGNARVGAVINFKSDTALLAQSARKIYRYNSGWTEFTGPSGNAALSAGSASSLISSAQWKGHLFITNDAGTAVMKIFKDGSTYKVRNAGLPALASSPSITSPFSTLYALANNLKSKINSHKASTAAHITAADPTLITAADATDLDELDLLMYQIGVFYDSHDSDAELAASWVYHDGQEGSDHSLSVWGGVPGVTAPSVFSSALNDMKTKYNAHDNDASAHGTTGAHQVTASTTSGFTTAYDSIVASYIYGFAYKYEYTVGSETFTDIGPVTQIPVDSYWPEISSNAISSIPVITNSTTGNYDTSVITVEIYRTKRNGTVLYKVGSVTNGTTTYTDSKADAELDDDEIIYTNGGVLDNDPPPVAKYIHIVNNKGYYGNVTEGSEAKPNRIRQSIENDIDSCPTTLYVNLPEENAGISSHRGVPIAFTNSGTYRLEGYFDELGNGSIQAVAISEGIGCIAPYSPVQTDQGVIFAGNDGFYITNGYQLSPISKSLSTTYSSITSTAAKRANITGALKRDENRVYWCVQLSDASSDNDSFLILDLDKGISEESSFTTASNGTSFAPTSVCVFNNQLIRADTRGYIFKHDSSYKSDPKVDTGTAGTNWAKKAVRWNYLSPHFDFGSLILRKWITKIIAKFKNVGDLSVQINSNNDMGRNVKELAPIRFRGMTTYGDAATILNDSTISSDTRGTIEEKRRFPAGQLRCSNKQVQITKAYVVIENSDEKGLVTVDATAKTATLVSSGTYDFVDDAVDYKISFEDDSYDTEFTITVRTADVVTFSDAGNLCPVNGNYKWVIKGYPKEESVEILSYSIPFDLVGQTQSDASGESGANT